MDLIDWFRTTLAHGLAEKAVATDQISRVILAGGSSQWPFVPDVVTETLGIDRSRLMRSDRPYAVISQGLAILPALQRSFEETRDKLRRDLPQFCRTRVRPLVERVTNNYVSGVAADVTSELFDRTIRPIVEEFREKGGSVKILRESIAAQVKADEGRFRAIIEKTDAHASAGPAGRAQRAAARLVRVVRAERRGAAHRRGAADGGRTGDRAAGHAGPLRRHHGNRRLVRRCAWRPRSAPPSAAAADSPCWRPVPAGWIAGAIIGAAVTFLAVRYGMTRAKELADTWNAPAWIVKNILLPSRIAKMRGDFQARLKETLQRETLALQDELEARIRHVTEKQIEGLSEVTQL